MVWKIQGTFYSSEMMTQACIIRVTVRASLQDL